MRYSLSDNGTLCLKISLLKKGERMHRDIYKTIHIECNELGDKALTELLKYFSNKKIRITNFNFSHIFKGNICLYKFVIKGHIGMPLIYCRM